MKSIVKEIGSFRFPGFYESVFSYADEFIDMEAELANEFNIKADLIHYEYTDFNKYKIDVCKTFMELYVDAINDLLPYDITEHDDFKFEIIDLDDIVVISPKYYNYSTDRCFCNIETNRATLQMIKDHTLGLKGVEKYLKDNFTSCDGFISFIPNNLGYWKSLDICEYEENMLIALLDMFLKLSNEDIFRDISYDTEENVCRYEYAEPMVSYNEKEYNLYDFIKLDLTEVSSE